MTEIETLKFNERCAKFLGVDLDYSTEVYKDSKSNLRQFIHNRSKSEPLLFDSDWNWIMQVKIKIQELNYVIKVISSPTTSEKWYSHKITIQKNIFTELLNNIFIVNYSSNYSMNESEINATVKALNEFLIWYDQNNK